MTRIENGDIQGLVVSGYRRLKSSNYYFLRFADANGARGWLRAIHGQITTADWHRDGKVERPKQAMNIAFTYLGLQALGLPQESLDTFAQEFCEGMRNPHRAIRLGDVDNSDPAKWILNGPAAVIDAILILQAPTRDDLEQWATVEIGKLAQFNVTVNPTDTIKGDLNVDEQEHFGFHDSISQPLIEGAPNHDEMNRDVIKAGEFVLGYPNEYGVLPPSPKLTLPPTLRQVESGGAGNPGQIDFGRNGSYMVVRRLTQDVAAFNRFLESNCGGDPEYRAWLGAKMVGRWPSGAPLVLTPNRDNPAFSNANDFCYLPTDKNGFGCPVGAHVRRSNPRDSLSPNSQESYRTVRRHRILRRGVSFGQRLPPGTLADDHESRGLLFIAINADIERQFEFIQQTWINDPKFGGLYRDRDPLVGSHPDVGRQPSDDDGSFTIQGEPVRRRLSGIQRFVTMTGGEYFFLPAISSLELLAHWEG